MNWLKNILTSRDNDTYSMSKFVALGTSGSMIYNFIAHHSMDFQGFGLGMSGIIATLAVKTYAEKP